jgi:hypothetical protein
MNLKMRRRWCKIVCVTSALGTWWKSTLIEMAYAEHGPGTDLHGSLESRPICCFRNLFCLFFISVDIFGNAHRAFTPDRLMTHSMRVSLRLIFFYADV